MLVKLRLPNSAGNVGFVFTNQQNRTGKVSKFNSDWPPRVGGLVYTRFPSKNTI